MNIESVRAMTESFNQEEIIENMKYILEKEKIEEIPQLRNHKWMHERNKARRISWKSEDEMT